MHGAWHSGGETEGVHFCVPFLHYTTSASFWTERSCFFHERGHLLVDWEGGEAAFLGEAIVGYFVSSSLRFV